MMFLAVERARWLGELARAIADAQRLVWELGSSTGLSSDMLDLCARLEIVRLEVDDVRRSTGRRRAEACRADITPSEGPHPFALCIPAVPIRS